MELNRRLRDIRKRHGLTQRELEAVSGVPQNTISRIEIGQTQEIGSKTLIALSRALQVTTDHLLGLDADASSQAKPKRRHPSARASRRSVPVARQKGKAV
jgi:transcriptional regulator with XRE-family HTH domain